jgi:hypothetical protein
VAADGTIEYRHADGFDGTDTFTYTISDGNGGTSTATVTVNIVAFVPSTITGFVYVDKDNDGVVDGFDIGLPNVLVTISGNDFNGNPIGDSIDATVVTDENGQYTFTDVPPSDANGYQITVAPVPFMVDGLETASNLDDTNTLGGATPAGYSSAVSGNNEITVNIPELGDVVSINNNFGVRGLDPTFVSLADIIAQGDFNANGLAAVGPGGIVAFAIAPGDAEWAEFSNIEATVSPDGETVTITADRNGQKVRATVPVDVPLNADGDKVRVIGTDNAGNVLVSFGGSPDDYGFVPVEGEAEEFAQAADAIFAEGFDG